MCEEIELVMNDDGVLDIAEEETKISFYLDEDGIFELLKAIKNNKDVGDIVEGMPLSIDGVSDGFFTRLQSIE